MNTLILLLTVAFAFPGVATPIKPVTQIRNQLYKNKAVLGALFEMQKHFKKSQCSSIQVKWHPEASRFEASADCNNGHMFISISIEGVVYDQNTLYPAIENIRFTYAG